MAETVYAGTDTFDDIYVSENGDGTSTFWENSFKKAVNCIRFLNNRTGTITGVVTADGAGAVAITSSRGGFTAAMNGNYIRITFSVARANANYGVQGTYRHATTNGVVQYGNNTTALFDLALFDGGGTIVNLSAGATSRSIAFSVTDLV